MSNTISITDLTKRSQEGLIEYANKAMKRYTSGYSMRSAMEEVDRDYARENDRTTEQVRARLANRMGDTSKFQNHTVPVVYPQVEAFVAYMTSVFLTGEPIFGVTSSAKYIEATMQMEALIADQATLFSWKAELIKLFRDAGKYNLAAMEVSWDKVDTPVFETDVSFSLTEARPKNVIWSGNKLKRLDLYNTFWDTSCDAKDVQAEGDYAGYSEMYTRNRLKKLIAGMDDKIIKNIKPAFESPTPALGVNGFYVPQINPIALMDPLTYAGNTDWFSFAGITDGKSDIAYKSVYMVTRLYVRLVPSDFDIAVPQKNTPQVWKLYIINLSVIIKAERLTNAHGYIPILFAAPNDDGLRYQTKGIGSNVSGIQALSTALMNSVIAARRRAVSDRAIYNPLYLSKADAENSNPSAKMPIKSTGYAGVDLNTIYRPIPFNDDQSAAAMQGVGILATYADAITGQNKAQQGQFVKGNKTLHEYDSVMGNANARSQLAAIVVEEQLFTPMKYILKCNILQYQQATSLYHEGEDTEINIDPVILRNAVMKFKVSDGLVPKDKLIGGEEWMVALQTLSTSPQLGAAYDIGGVFSYLMRTQGADIKQFEKAPEVRQYEAAMAQWQQVAQMVTETNAKMGAKEGYKQQSIPPQPLPKDFGLDQDGKPMKEKDENKQPTLIQQVMMQDAAQQGASNEQA